MSSESRSTEGHSPRTSLLRELTGLDAQQQSERLAYFDIGPADRDVLQELAPFARRTVDGIVAEFYEHLLKFPELAELLHEEPGRLERLRAIQRAYFLELTQGRFDDEYFETRLRVGDAHQRVGLRPPWYLGAFALYLRLVLRAVAGEMGEGERLLPAFEAIIKTVFLDMSLAMNSYIYGGFVQREIATELERAAQVAEQALRAHADVERAKDELSRMVVHDLKNPVSGIAMLTQLALRKGQNLPATHRGYLRQIDLTCREMMRLIQNLLEIGKIEEDKMPVVLEAVSLADLADEVVREYAAVAEQAQQELQAHVRHDLPPAAADRWLLRRVLINLVANAIRHSGSRDVHIDAVEGPHRGEITLRVTDSGRGIAPDDQALIFERFRSGLRSPLDDPSMDTGLGLSFCKLAVERMEGRIELTSRPGETVFALTLPARDRAAS
jgi:signal transduction histidine kinase